MPNPNIANNHHRTKNLLFFSLEDWDQIWRRNQFFCANLLNRNPDAQILWISPSVDAIHNAMRGVDSKHDPFANPVPVPGFPRVWQYKPLKLLPNKIGRAINNTFMRALVEQSIKYLDWREFDIWVNDHRARQYAPLRADRKIIYDITDDWTEVDQPEHIKQSVIADDNWLLLNADAVIVCSKHLNELKTRVTDRVELIPNGVDYERYHPDSVRKLQRPVELQFISGPIVGYTGTLHSDRLDVKLLDETAKALPAVHFVLVGPNELSEEDTKKLTGNSNLLILGGRPYNELPAYISAFNMCMCPHRVTPFTESLDPLKLYEYMSTGLPIISTKCSGFRDFPDEIALADDANSFARAIQDNISEDSNSEIAQRRLIWAAAQSWSRRVARVEEILNWA